ncbi:galactose-1-phosphate uridylyltransferase [Arabiibacter massiliensis]|uniref:galactose-1-phosphate uridylyltransferase n=1 Tax=Arabiibacter massiliensis TaxID=1870985 RepID=UPI0009BB7764|nr:galactose-1-phosphate uridylyltransferase [Arabiibacter massiliensis]
MGAALPAPEEVRAEFDRLRAQDAEAAVAYLHDLGTSSGYIDEAAVARTIRWTAGSPYGELEITINRSKPEKDPRAIAAAARNAGTSAPAGPGIPRCDLCWENEGFPGAPGRLPKPGLRIAAIELGGERWGLQFSPYAYFDEHCIALSAEHRPMKIDLSCLARLLDFADLFPFYFVGSNADLPIVGGSILSHDHLQGGRHTFPLMRVPIEREVPLAGLPQVRCGVVRWPASTLRLRSCDRDALARAAARILETWQDFSFEPCGIVAHDADGRHNTLNPIVHREGSDYVMHLVLRNNRADAERPGGVFHPGAELHHIKKENIGLIEIMGLAILPPRLARELPQVQRELADAARAGRTPQEAEARLRAHEDAAPHAAWAAAILARRAAELAREPHGGAIGPILRDEVARAFAAILETAGVFKRDPAGQAGWKAFLRILC